MSCCQRLFGATAILVILAMAGAANAQPPGRGPGGPGGPPGGPGGFGMFGRGPGGGDQTFRLLTRAEVQEELELVDDQKEKLKAIADQMREKMQKEFSGIRDIPQEERRAKMEEMQKKAETWAQEARKQIEEILLPHQLDRLHEISIQVRGIGALLDSRVQDDLGLNEQQKTKIRDLREKATNDARALFEGLRDLPAEERRAKMNENREKVQQMMRDGQEQLMGVLSEQQRTKFEEMKGKKIELAPPERPEGRRGGPGEGRGREGRGRGRGPDANQ